MSVGDAKRRKTPAELDAQAEMVKKLIRICERNKVAFNLHNHIYEVADGEYDLKNTLQRVPAVNLGPDLDWLRGAGVDPIDFIRRNGPRIDYCHLRDRDAKNVWTEALGEGTTDFAAIRKALDSVGFQGDVAIELAFPPDFKPQRPIREDLKISREYVRRTMGW
jgi:sugar phosphate isomerase/epimerase